MPATVIKPTPKASNATADVALQLSSIPAPAAKAGGGSRRASADTPSAATPSATGVGSRRASDDASGKPPLVQLPMTPASTAKKCRYTPCTKPDCPYAHDVEGGVTGVGGGGKTGVAGGGGGGAVVPTATIVITLHSPNVSRESLGGLLSVVGDAEQSRRLLERMPAQPLHLFQGKYPLAYLNFDGVDEAEAWMAHWTASAAAKTYFTRAQFKRPAASEATPPASGPASGNRSRAESVASAASS